MRLLDQGLGVLARELAGLERFEGYLEPDSELEASFVRGISDHYLGFDLSVLAERLVICAVSQNLTTEPSSSYLASGRAELLLVHSAKCGQEAGGVARRGYPLVCTSSASRMT